MSPELQIALVVDDDPIIRSIATRLLEALGYRVTEAADGRAGLETLKAGRAALVCLDLMLPEMDGYEVLESIRRTPELAQTPVMIMSARCMPEDRATAEELGVVAYLTKPFTPNQFREGVRRTVGAELPWRGP